MSLLAQLHASSAEAGHFLTCRPQIAEELGLWLAVVPRNMVVVVTYLSCDITIFVCILQVFLRVFLRVLQHVQCVVRWFSQVVAGESRCLQARHRLCRLVAAAAGAWQRFFVVPGPPQDLWHLWVSLLEALMACAKWGHKLAAMALPTWLSLYFGCGLNFCILFGDAFWTASVTESDAWHGTAWLPRHSQALKAGPEARKSATANRNSKSQHEIDDIRGRIIMKITTTSQRASQCASQCASCRVGWVMFLCMCCVLGA